MNKTESCDETGKGEKRKKFFSSSEMKKKIYLNKNNKMGKDLPWKLEQRFFFYSFFSPWTIQWSTINARLNETKVSRWVMIMVTSLSILSSKWTKRIVLNHFDTFKDNYNWFVTVFSINPI